MPSYSFRVSGIKPFLRRLKDLGEDAKQVVDDEMTAGALDMVRIAKRLAPVDEGPLRNSIGADTTKQFQKEFFVTAFYAAYREFGTGKKVKIPSGYEQMAAAAKSLPNRGNAMQFFYRLVQWVHRKGLGGTYSIKTQRRTGNRKTQAEQDYQVAYLIMREILRNGSRGTPFMIPAYEQVVKTIPGKILKRIRKI